ncbi:hypothetical protein AMAG_13836 [Allomyces macrogynus ATCC 38327]|uniref:DUF4211 domain-containing protein n=1 Tax=Allomyces macrogynus (strain ATCC 38327) TaxID=578462 RepID=A0A0L0T2U8_ALLM3|nr:hypothetical protein AMAG_13836 [Allomyces macrogynus ATCC 38327]|eukprot:KNE68960.1 hypothetical protein AMAG_13836 [Allomyces macrogynus ATCC 38327]
MPRPNPNPAPAERASAFDRMMDVAHARAGRRGRTSTAIRAPMPTPPATAPSQTVRKKRLLVPDSTTDDDDDDGDGARAGGEELATWTPAPTHDVVVLDDSDSNDDQPLSTAALAALRAETVIKSPARTGRRRTLVVTDSDGDGDNEGESAPVITSPRSRARSKRSRHIASDSDSDEADAPVAKVRRRAPPVIEDDAEDFDVDASNIIKSTETRKRSRGSIRDRLDRARVKGTATAAPVPSWTAVITVPGASSSDSDGSDDSGGTDSNTSLANNVLDDEEAGSELEGFIASDAEDAETVGASAAAIPLAFRSMSEMDWFTLFIRFLIRVVVAPKVANALRRNREHPLTEGWYKVLEQIQSREQVMQSTVWSAELKEALETYPQAKETSDPIMSECQACNRGDRTTSARITLSGAPYDPKTLQTYETAADSDSDSDGGSDVDTDSSASSSPSPTPASRHKFVISAGRFCAMRLIGYHTLHHYIYHCARRLRTALGTADLELETPESAFETAQIMLGIGVEDEDNEDGFVVEEFRRFERLLEDADDTLSNRVGALERTRRGGGAGRWGR